MVTAWDIRTQMRRRSVERAVANGLVAATALHEEPDEIIGMVTSVTQRLPEPRGKALILSYVAQLLTDSGRADVALHLLLLALECARLAGPDTVLEVLANGAETLAAVDDGRLLIRISHQVETIDSWFGAG